MIDHLKSRLTSNEFLSDPHNIARGVLLVLIIAAAVFVSLNYTLADIKAYLRDNTGQTILVSLLIYISFGLTFLPSLPLTLFIAVLFGPLHAAIIATVGNTLAALLSYQVGKTIGDVVDFDGMKSKLPLGLGRLPIESPYFLLAARSIPAGTRGFSMVCGAYQVPLLSYTWTTFTMYFISSTLFAFGSLELLKFI